MASSSFPYSGIVKTYLELSEKLEDVTISEEDRRKISTTMWEMVEEDLEARRSTKMKLVIMELLGSITYKDSYLGMHMKTLCEYIPGSIVYPSEIQALNDQIADLRKAITILVERMVV